MKQNESHVIQSESKWSNMKQDESEWFKSDSNCSKMIQNETKSINIMQNN